MFPQKVIYETQNCKVNDCLLVYDYEGEGSSAGSVGCCSLLGADDDLAFLDDLGSKFTTLAQICKPPKPIAVSKAASQQSEVKRDSSISTSTVKVTQAPPPPPVQPTVSETTRTISNSATLPRMLVRETVPIQTVLVQQQQQPLYYLVEPQVQHRVVLAERPPVGLGQGVLLVNSGPVLQEVMPRQTATTMSPTLLLQGGQTLVHSTLPRATIAGSQHVVAVTQGQTFNPAPQQVHALGQERVVLLDRQVGMKSDSPGSGRTLWPTSQITSRTLSTPTVPTYESGLLSSEQVNMAESNITHVQIPQPQQSFSTTGFLDGGGHSGLATAKHSMSSFSNMGIEETISVAAVPQVPPIITGSTQLEAELQKKDLFDWPTMPAVEDMTTNTTQQEEISVESHDMALAEEHGAVEIEADKARLHLEIDSTGKATGLSEDESDDVVEPDMEAAVEHEEALTVSSQVLDVTESLDMSVTEDPSLTGTITGNTDAGWTVDEYASETVLSAPEILPEDTDIIDLVADQITVDHSLQGQSEMVEDTITLSLSEMEVSATQDTHAEETEDEVYSASLEDTLKAVPVDGPSELTPSVDIPISDQETTVVSVTEMELGADMSAEASQEMFQRTDLTETTESTEISHEQMQQVATGQVEAKYVAMEGDSVIVNQVVTTASGMNEVTAVEMQVADPAPVEEECEVEEIRKYTGQIPKGQTTEQNVEEHEDLQKEDAFNTGVPKIDKPIQAEEVFPHHEQLLEEEEVGSTQDTEALSEAEKDLEGESLEASDHQSEVHEAAQVPMDYKSQEFSAVVMQTESTASVDEKIEVEWKETRQMPEGQTFGQDIEEHQDLQIEDDVLTDFPESEEPLQEEEEPTHYEKTLDVKMPNIAEQDLQDGSLDASEEQTGIHEETQEPDEEDMSDAGSMSVQCSTAYSEQTDDLSDSDVAEEDKMSDGYGEAVLDAEVTPVKPEEVQPCDNEDMMLSTNVAQSAVFVESEMSLQTVKHTIAEREVDSVVVESHERHMSDVAVIEEDGISVAAEEELAEASSCITEINLGVATVVQPDSQPGSEEEEEVQTETEETVGAAEEPEAEAVSAESGNTVAKQVDSIVTAAVSDEAEEPVGFETAVDKPEFESEASMEVQQITPQSISEEVEEQRAEPQARRVEMETEESGMTLEVLQALEIPGDLDLQQEAVEASGTNLSAGVGDVLHSVVSSQEMEADSPTAEPPEEVDDREEGQRGQVALPQEQELGATAAASSSSMSKKQKKASKKASKEPKSPKSPMGKCKQQ